MFNKVILIGRIGNKPTLKEGKEGAKYCNFSLVTNTGFGDKKVTDWHSVTAFNKTAESCANYLDKGSLLLVEGHIRYDIWEKDGKKNQKTTIIADKINFFPRTQSGGQPQESQKEIPQTQEQSPADFYTPNEPDIDDIPF